jgi:hypothetical protein
MPYRASSLRGNHIGHPNTKSKNSPSPLPNYSHQSTLPLSSTSHLPSPEQNNRKEKHKLTPLLLAHNPCNHANSLTTKLSLFHANRIWRSWIAYRNFVVWARKSENSFWTSGQFGSAGAEEDERGLLSSRSMSEQRMRRTEDMVWVGGVG